MSCHPSCQSCVSQVFTGCLTCPRGLALSQGACFCTSSWASACTGESVLRELIQLLTMFMNLLLVGVMVLYILRARLPISYRVWSGLNGLSLLIYNEVFYLQYEDQLMLRSLALSNGPYFASARIMGISTSHIFPTLALVIIMAAMLLLLHFPLQTFHRDRETILEYIVIEGPHLFDCAYFFASRMMFFFISKFIGESGSASVVYIVVTAVYGAFILGAWVRFFYQYHRGTLQAHAYEVPIHIYTLLAPASLIGLMMVQSYILLIVVYCSPLALLLLILLLNRDMKIFTWKNAAFFVTELLAMGITVCFILLGDPIKTYVLVGAFFLAIIAVFGEAWMLYYGGVNLASAKVHPSKDTESELPEPKKVHITNNEQKQGYY